MAPPTVKRGVPTPSISKPRELAQVFLDSVKLTTLTTTTASVFEGVSMKTVCYPVFRAPPFRQRSERRPVWFQHVLNSLLLWYLPLCQRTTWALGL